MKIIVANYRYFIAGGPEKYMFKFIDAAIDKGIEVIPFSIKNPQNETSSYSKYFAKPRSDQLFYKDTKFSIKNIIGMLRSTIWNYDAEKRLKQLIRDTNPDAIYILHEINHLSPSIIRAARKEKIRIVHRISDFFMFCPKYDFLCGDEICESCIHGNYQKAIKNKCVKKSFFGTCLRVLAMKLYNAIKVFDDVHHFITTCEFSKNKLIEGGIVPNKITCVPTFIDSTKIIPNYNHEKYFLFLGRMAHQKGTLFAIEAMKYLKNSEYKLKITGSITDSQEDQEIWKFILDNELSEKIIFTGFKHGTELETLINNSTCIVCPAIWYENMPNTVIEAYAHGKPVVASRIGSLSEIVIDNETGYLFEMKNSEDLANKLSRFIDNPMLSETLGKKARKVCEELYSVDHHMDKVIDILKGE